MLYRPPLVDIFHKLFIFIMILSENKFSILDHYNNIKKQQQQKLKATIFWIAVVRLVLN